MALWVRKVALRVNLSLKLPKIQRHQARVALFDRQVPGGIPQGHVRFAVLGIGFQAVGAGCQGIQAEVGAHRWP